MRAMASSSSARPPHQTIRMLAASARSRRESTSVPSRSKTINESLTQHSRRVATCLASAGVVSERRGRLPDPYPDDAQAVFDGVVVNQSRDPFDGRIAVEEEHGLAELLEGLDERIVAPQQHLVIERVVDPPLHRGFDVAEVAHHIPAVELARLHLDLHE